MTDPLTFRARMLAPIKVVRHALTDQGALETWFAEHAEVDLPHRYAFWGRHTPDGAEPHQRLVHADDNVLRFVWTIDGEETTTEIALEEESEETTIVALSQSGVVMAEGLAESSVRGVLMTFWAFAVSNLADYVAGRPITPLVDFTSSELRTELVVHAPVEKVYESLIDSEQASAWFGYPIGIEPEVGGRFAMGGFDNPHPAKIVDLRPGTRMAVDFGPNGIATWDLEGSEGETRLMVVQSGFKTPRTPYTAWCGTLAGFAELRRYHELPDWQPIFLAA
jgi:uncharacterized protein YndB with AHSA1/START domain